jgi:repressor LexA
VKLLTHTQKEVLGFILQCIERAGLPPTRIEISERFGWASPNAAQCHLVSMQRKGYITLLSGKAARGIVVHRHAGKSPVASARFKEGEA